MQINPLKIQIKYLRIFFLIFCYFRRFRLNQSFDFRRTRIGRAFGTPSQMKKIVHRSIWAIFILLFNNNNIYYLILKLCNFKNLKSFENLLI